MELIDSIAACMHASTTEISNIKDMKKGMTNNSWLFDFHNKTYVYRQPGIGSNQLCNRAAEAEAYKAVRWLHMSDEVVYFNKDTGVKIAEYIRNGRACDSANMKDVEDCLLFLKRTLHAASKTVSNEFDAFKMIEKYEMLAGNAKKADDYDDVRQHVFALRQFTRKNRKKYCLCHIDPNQDNFLICKSGIKLLDWEYAAMQDPLIDVAMFIIYAGYDKQHADMAIDAYLEHKVDILSTKMIYAYIAMSGFLWYDWCRFKIAKGNQQFSDEYMQSQYDYAKQYASII